MRGQHGGQRVVKLGIALNLRPAGEVFLVEAHVTEFPSSAVLEAELLLHRCRRGDRDAFAELVGRWELRLFYYICRLVDDEQNAWDILQQTWIRVLRGVGRLRDPSRLAPWLYRVARNTALSHCRSLAAHQRMIDPEAEVGDVSDGQEIPSTWRAEAVHAALQKLSLPHREVLTLFFLQDLSIEQIADVVGVPAGTVKSRLHYARQAIREVLEQEGVDHV